MSFEDISPAEFEVPEEGVEDQEVAEPEAETMETGAEDQEIAEPESEEPEGRTAADAAFAEMRRRAEEAERQYEEMRSELESLKAQQTARQAALANMDVDDVEAIAESLGITREEVLDNIAREEEAAEAEIRSKEKDQEIESLKAQLTERDAEMQMAEDLEHLRKLDPEIKSLEDLGEDFAAYIMAGLSAEQAYYAIKGKELTTKSIPATPPGRISDTAPPEKDFFSESDVANMTSAEKEANWEKIMASLPKWGKR